MTTRVLGLDIQEEQLCAVVVEQRAAEVFVLSCASVEVKGIHEVPLVLPDLLQQLESYTGPCVLGLPLSVISLRNLILPFTDRKKINQVLPLELEEQLLEPMDQQIIDFKITGRKEAGSVVLVAALEKEYLHSFLPALEKNDLVVRAVIPTMNALVHEYLDGMVGNDIGLFLYADAHAMNMALVSEGKVVFLRRIAYPDHIFVHSLFDLQNEVSAPDQNEARKSVTRLCNSIKNSLYHFQHENGVPKSVQRTVLSGSIVGKNWWYEMIGQELDLKVTIRPPRQKKSGIQFSSPVREQWNPRLYDSALALALTGLKKKQMAVDLNFLQGEFAPPKLYLSKRALVAAAGSFFIICLAVIGFLLINYRSLDSRSANLQEEMVKVFKSTFPEAVMVKGIDPLAQMKSKLREVKTSEVSIPLFSGEKRVLELLADISDRIPKEISLHVSRMVIDQESVQVKGTTDAYNNVDVIKNKLAASPRYGEVKIVSATADKNKNSIRFEIHLQLAESS